MLLRGLLSGAVFMLLTVSADVFADDRTAIYDHDSQHMWNRLYRAIAVRTDAGIQYGIDNSVPFDEDFDDPVHVAEVLDEFLKSNGEDRASGDLRRALLLHDVWAAFDLAARQGHEELRYRLATVVGRLRMRDEAIAGLPDNYAAAVKLGKFNREFDPEHPDEAFLPPDLFDTNGPWVEIGESGRGLVAPVHVEALSGRSAFRVFHPLPRRTEGYARLSRKAEPVPHALGAQAGADRNH